MFAYRLAEHVAHTTDVDGMLDAMTPQQFAYWMAKDLIEPIGTRATADILSKIGQLIAGLTGAKIEDKDFRPWAKTVSDEALSSDEAGKAIKSILGGAVRG